MGLKAISRRGYVVAVGDGQGQKQAPALGSAKLPGLHNSAQVLHPLGVAGHREGIHGEDRQLDGVLREAGVFGEDKGLGLGA